MTKGISHITVHSSLSCLLAIFLALSYPKSRLRTIFRKHLGGLCLVADARCVRFPEEVGGRKAYWGVARPHLKK